MVAFSLPFPQVISGGDQGYRIWILANWEEDVDEEVVVPAGPFQLAPHGAFARFHRARFSASLRSRARFSAQCPFRFRAWSSLQVTPIPNAAGSQFPNGPDDVIDAPAASGSAGSPGFLAGLAVLLTGGCYLANSLQTRPVMLLLQPVNVELTLAMRLSMIRVPCQLGPLRHRRGTGSSKNSFTSS